MFHNTGILPIATLHNYCRINHDLDLFGAEVHNTSRWVERQSISGGQLYIINEGEIVCAHLFSLVKNWKYFLNKIFKIELKYMSLKGVGETVIRLFLYLLSL